MAAMYLTEQKVAVEMSNDKTTDIPFMFGETLNTTQDSLQTEGSLIAKRYKLLETIGKGGMGKIYRAEDLNLGREVAIKVMLAPDDEISAKRFMQEAAITASLRHPNTISVFDFGKMDDGSLFLVMEYIDGINIKQSIVNNGAFPPTQAMKLACQLCGSLGEAHRNDLIHRDIKPGNVMLIDSPEEGLIAKLLDFGLVKHTEKTSDISQTGTILGSPMYMSPEQINGEIIDSRSDIYSLGLTLYYMLSAKSPFSESNISGILAAQLFKTPIPIIEQNSQLASCPALNWIIDRATEKKPANRFRSILQMKQALEIALDDGRASLKLIEGELYHKDVLIEGNAMVGLKKGGSPLSSSESSATLRQETKKLGIQDGNSQTMQLQLQRNTRIVGLIAISSLFLMLMLVWTVKKTFEAPAPTVVQTPVVQTVQVKITSSPDKVEIYKDGKKIGTTPVPINVIGTEKYDIEARKEGYTSDTYEVSRLTPIVNIELKSIPEPQVEPTVEPKSEKPTVIKSKRPKKNKKKKVITKDKPKPKKSNKKVITNPMDD